LVRSARVILPVSAPFHSALMMPAQEKLAADLATVQFSSLRVPLVTNVDADTIEKGEEARNALVRQVSMPVRWEESIRLMVDEGVNTFVEVGPGRVLTGLLRQIERSVRGTEHRRRKEFDYDAGKDCRRKSRRCVSGVATLFLTRRGLP